MLMRRSLFALPLLAATPALAVGTVRIGQATTSLSFLPLWAARALGTFDAQGLALSWAAIPGGDPAALAALDSGDLDLAAVGGETALQAIGKGQPFSSVYSLMSRMSLDLVVGPAVPAELTDPLETRLAALKGITVGVSAVGGTQDRAVRWLAAKGGLARTALRVAMVGGPPALQAALENKRIDAFILSPPEAQIAEAGGYGHTLISLATDFSELRALPFLVLVAKRPFVDPDRIRRTVRALQAAAHAVQADPDGTADAIAAKFFPKAPPGAVRAATQSMKDGVTNGALSAASIDALVTFSTESGNPITGIGPDAWTKQFIK